MLALYTSALLLLGVAHLLISRRCARLERKYYRIATTADQLVNRSHREAAGAKGDPYQIARRQFELGLLVQKRDRVEGQYDRWQKKAKRFGGLVARVRSWKGTRLPYACGAIDAYVLPHVLDRFGVGEYASVSHLWSVVTTHLLN
jgi:hypothetical protein